MSVAKKSESDYIEEFSKAMQDAGYELSEIEADGKVHRFHVEGDRSGRKNGWYFLHVDGLPNGAFGNWKTSERFKWSSSNSASKEDRETVKRFMAKAKAARQRDKKNATAAAQRRAVKLWESAEAIENHPYLEKKGVQAFGVRRLNDVLLVPLRNINGDIRSLQFINAEGEKRFLPSGEISGNHHLIGEVKERLIICEGYATAATIHEATGEAVAVAFNCGNLKPAAEAIREKFPDAQIVIAGDNDAYTEGNPGETKAVEAASAVGGLVTIPVFKDTSSRPTDFNDLHVLEGEELVRDTIGSAKPVHSGQVSSISSPEPAHLHTPPDLAKKPDILAVFIAALCRRGVVGEERNAKLIYLAMTSRLLDEPVSLAIKGVSSSGKSFTTESTSKFFPKSAILEMTAMSERALVYSKEDFKHRTIILFEAVALREQREKNDSNMTAYFVRSLLSEGRINYPVSVRDKEEGGWTTKTIVKEGPTNLIITTTSTSLHGENETRLISLPTNDTPDQTKAILRQLAAGRPNEMDFTEWHKLQEWLAKSDRRVVIPYAGYLAEKIPPIAVRLRRDFRSILRLIETHAILHQATRERDDEGRIIAIEADYQAVRVLVADLVSEGIGATVPKTVRETVECVRTWAGSEGVKVNDVAEKMGLDRTSAQRRIQTARERGYILNLEDKRGRAARYAPDAHMPEEIELLPQNLGGVQVCSDSGGEGNGADKPFRDERVPQVPEVRPGDGADRKGWEQSI